MSHISCALLYLSCFPGSAGTPAMHPQSEQGCSFLYQPAYAIDNVLRGPTGPYTPQAGDLFFATDRSFIVRLGHHLAGAAAPHHSGLVIQRADGSFAVMEAGPQHTVDVGTYDLLPSLNEYAQQGAVYIRPRRIPLTAEQSAQLTAFAEAQVGKRFAWGRMLGQLTPFRSRGPIRTKFVGKPHGDRNRYFCAEMVMEALVAACIVDGETARPAAMYPRDLFFGRSPNPYLDQTLDLEPGWLPPSRWSPQSHLCSEPGPPALTPASPR